MGEKEPNPLTDEERMRMNEVFDRVERKYAELEWHANDNPTGLRLVPVHQAMVRAGSVGEVEVREPSSKWTTVIDKLT